MRVAWATDVHLSFLTGLELRAFVDQILDARPGALLLSGDLAEADSAAGYVAHLEEALAVPVWFVLGNHDYYGGSIAGVRAELGEKRGYLHGRAEPVALTARTGLVGCDGWGDARLGNPDGSRVLLNDWSDIHDFAALGALRDARVRIEKLRALGDESAAALEPPLSHALERFEHTIVVTHVPPFAGATWHDGKQSNDDWMPWFSCRATGDVLERLARAHPARRITVLCGHTHGAGTYQPLPNLVVRTGAAAYGAPALADVWEER